MPLYFFHLRTEQGLQVDDLGTSFPDLDAAYLDVCRTIPNMVSDLLAEGLDPVRCGFEIVDREGQVLLQVPFLERLQKGGDQCRPALAGRPQGCVDLFDTLDRLMVAMRIETARLRRNVTEARMLANRTRTAGLCDASFLEQVAQAYGLHTGEA